MNYEHQTKVANYKVVVEGHRSGEILYLTKGHAQGIAKRINDDDHEFHGYDIYNCEHRRSHAKAIPMENVRPCISTNTEEADYDFLRDYLESPTHHIS
tara:strand:- start:227 stop:520 length:294 start_codon:yes stop_codon:yes gene_type:complete